MKIDYEDYFDDEYYEDEDNYRQVRSHKFKDLEKPSAGDNSGKKKNIRRRRKEKIKQRESEEHGEIDG